MTLACMANISNIICGSVGSSGVVDYYCHIITSLAISIQIIIIIFITYCIVMISLQTLHF